MKLKLPIILSLLFLLGLKGFSENKERLDVWSTPVSFELEAVALLNLPDALFYASKNELSLAKVESYVAPPCPVAGTSCDDKNPNTINDVADGNCNCSGVPIALLCEDVEIAYQINNGVRENAAAVINLSQTDSVELFANLQGYVVRDPKGDIVPGNRIDNILPSQAGEYTVNTTFRRATAIPKVVSVSSEEAGEGILNAFDGDPGTFWHSRYSDVDPDIGYPHVLVFDMGEGSVLSGFTYLPRTGELNNGGTNGRIGTYDIFISNTTGSWGTAVVLNGVFPPTDVLKTVRFTPRQGRYLRFVAKTPAYSSQVWATAAELSVLRGGTATASSAASGNPVSNATDNVNTTYWQTASGATGAPYITLDLGIESNVSGLTYLPIQSGTSTTGRITAYQIFVSNSPTVMGTVVTSGTWLNSNNNLKTANFTETRGRYVRLVSTAGTVAAAAQVRAIAQTVNFPCTKTITINVTPRTTYSFNNGTWSPIIPVSGTTANDILIINAGDATIATAMTCNKLIVNPGASLTIAPSGVITATSTTLKSASNTFSSLIVNGTIIGVVNYERWVNKIGTSSGGGNDLISSPLQGVTFNNAFRIANLNNLPENPDPIKKGIFAFAPYNVTDGAYQNFDIGTDYSGAEPIVLGVGYRAAANVSGSQTGNILNFSGTVAANAVDVPVSDAVVGRAWNLIGNPYPSYVSVGGFFTSHNIAQINDNYVAIYGYKGNKSDWEIYNLAHPDERLAPGQGFFVKAKEGGGIVQFTPAMRTVGSSDDFIAGRSNTSKALSKLKLSSPSKEVSTSVYFIEGTTRGLDPGYDAAVYGATAVDFSIFTNLVKDNSKLDIAIQSLPYDDFNGVVVPLGIKAKAGTELVISIDELSTIPSNVNAYLEDIENKTLTLLNNKGFRFTPSVDINSSDLYKIHYSARTLSVDDMQMNDDLRIYTTAAPKALFVKGQLTKNTTASLYDIQGRLVLRKVLNSNSTENKIDISTINTGVYVVKINNDNQVKTQKVIIK